MKQPAAVKTVMAILAGTWALNAIAAEPTISNVSVHQRWPWSRLVNIDYTLTCDDSNRVAVTVTAYNSATPLTLPSASLSGDVDSVLPGTRRIVWDPAKTAYTNELLTQFRVDLTPALSPAYMIVNLTDGQKTYRYDWSTWYDVTNHTEYMTTNLVLRHILPGTFMMGTPTNYLALKNDYTSPEDYHPVTLTKGFYIGIFQVTQKQWALLMNNAWPSYFTNALAAATRPVELVSYSSIRGTLASSVDANSFMGKLQTLAGVDFELPTEAQWEYACRAGTDTPFNDSVTSPTDSTVSLLARYRFNSNSSADGTNRNADATMGTARVGSYQTNPWGLYDMHGNVWELCLDGLVPNLGTDAVTDPVSTASTAKIIRGSTWDEAIQNLRSAARLSVGTASAYRNVGFRVKAAEPGE